MMKEKVFMQNISSNSLHCVNTGFNISYSIILFVLKLLKVLDALISSYPIRHSRLLLLVLG